MSFKKFLDKKVVLIQTGSASKLTPKQKANLIGLGLRRIGSKSELIASNSVLGMIAKVQHVITVQG